MLSDVLNFLFDLTAKGMIGSIVTNLLSEFLSMHISDNKLKLAIVKCKKELYAWSEQFQKSHDGSVMTNGAFISYLGNFRVTEKIYAYAFSEEEVHLDEENFLRELVEGSIRAMQAAEVPVSVPDESILREFYKKLLEKIKKFARHTKGMEHRELLYQINQVRLGNQKIYDELLKNSNLTEKALQKLEDMHLETTGLLKKNGPELDMAWFRGQNTEAIRNMGDRYMPELNVNLSVQSEFDLLAANKAFFERIQKSGDKLLIWINRLGEQDKKMWQMRGELLELMQDMNSFAQFNEKKEALQTLVDKIRDAAEEEIHRIFPERRMPADYQKQALLHQYIQIQNAGRHMAEEIGDKTVQLMRYPFLLIHGKGGVGKSHLIAATVEKRMQQEQPSVLLLGADFPENCIIWQRLTQLLKTETDEDMFLGRLNALAQQCDGRILLFLDAMNEGGGRKLWKDRLESFIAKIGSYPYLGLAFSIRDEFMEEITPQSLIDKCHITELSHTGFGTDTLEAVRIYFIHYEIELSILPYIPREFSNGLFLRLFCEGHRGRKKADIAINTGEIYRNYLKSLNGKLAERYGYSKKYDFINEVLQEFVRESYTKNTRNQLSEEQAAKLIFLVAGKYQIPTRIYDDLFAEGVLTQTVEGDREYVYITYERLADHIFVMSRMNDIACRSRSDEELIEELDQPGILEELACMLPEYGMEVFERFPQLAGRRKTADAVLESMAWRTREQIDEEKLLTYVNRFMVRDPYLNRKFKETLTWLTTDENHVFNAQFFHENLLRLSMADRDAQNMELFLSWQNENSPIAHLFNWIDFVDEGKAAASEQQIYLCALMLGWMLIVTDQHYRDRVSVALCRLLRGHAPVMKQVLAAFETVDDVYILERLYAVALGVVVFEPDVQSVGELAEYVYETIFDQETVIADILIRDSAKELVGYAQALGADLHMDVRKVIGPYTSVFPKIPDDAEIESYRLDAAQKDLMDIEWAQNRILNSMQIDDENHWYGDFGRYVFQYYFDGWEEPSAADLMKIAVKNVFERGYDREKHGSFDFRLGQHGRMPERVERIGKKYQWQAFYQLAAQVSDHYRRKNESNGEMEYQTGAYEPNLRRFDPTVNDKSFVGKFGTPSSIVYDNYEMPPDRWLKNSDDAPDFESLVTTDIDGEPYLGLYVFWNWEEPAIIGFERYDRPAKNMWFMSQAYFVREEDFELCRQALSGKNFWGRWMPEPTDNYSLYNREYYWSDAHRYFENEYYGGSEWKRIWKRDLPALADVSFLVPVYSYIGTGENAFQNIRLNRWKKPCRALYTSLQLTYGMENTVMYGGNGEVACFDTSEIFGEDRGFFFNQRMLEQFMEKHHCRLIWQFLGAKQMIGGSYQDSKNLPGDMQYSGFYYLENGKLEGKTEISL